MSTPINDGGPAFPVPLTFHPTTCEPCNTGHYWDGNGMTLRDYFASAALQGILAHTLNPNSLGNSHPDHATVSLPGETPSAMRAYSYADAMLAERAKKGGVS